MADRRTKGGTLSFEFVEQAPAAQVAPPPPAEPASAQPPSAPPPVPEPPPAPAAPAVLTVGQLGRVLGRALDRAFPGAVWVEGEVTGARPAPSGHLYFCLRDEEEEASIDIVMYRTSVTPRARALVKDGARIRIRARATYYAPRGRLQLTADRVDPTGKGALLEALEKLKAKLAAEGLFAPERKRPLPSEPRVVGVVTSRTGAVIHDVCKVAFQRGGARILLAPAQVQGPGAPESIVRALTMIQRVAEVDVIIVGRGGGSQDDLLAFWDESVARAVAACRVPIVSAVGHEVDVTLVDFVADARAATPSQAAEKVVPDARARRRLLDERTLRLSRAVHARIQEDRVQHARLGRAFRDPRLLIATAQQRVDDRIARLGRAFARGMVRRSEERSRLGSRLSGAHPRERLAKDERRVSELRGRLVALAHARVATERSALAASARVLAFSARERIGSERGELRGIYARLDAMSPLKVLGRGYAIATRPDGTAVRSAREVSAGDRIHLRFAEGSAEATVESTASAPESKK